MKHITLLPAIAGLAFIASLELPAAELSPPSPMTVVAPPKVPAFSVDYMDRSVNPATNFYQFAAGQWLKDNPVPADKSRWASFSELAERNWYLIHEILVTAALQAGSLSNNSPARKVGDFFISAMNTNLIEQLGFQPIAGDLQKIDQLKSTQDLFELLADFHQRGIGGMFGAGFGPDEKNSSIYAIQLDQGGLSLPDRDYYLKDNFAEKLAAYREHVQKMFVLLGEKPEVAATNAATVVALETALAQASRPRVDLRDPNRNYNKSRHRRRFHSRPDGPRRLLWNVYSPIPA